MNANIVCSGALFYTLSTNRFLFLHRSNGKKSDVWGLVGGTNEGTETPWEGLKREIVEEIGDVTTIKKTLPLESFLSNDKKFLFHTYLCVVEDEFIPKLNKNTTVMHGVVLPNGQSLYIMGYVILSKVKLILVN